MWLLERKPARVRRICAFCGGCFGLARPSYPYCSPYCAAWAAHEETLPPDLPDQDLANVLRYP